MTNLSKAFDCLSHELLLAMLYAYRFVIVALRLIHSCLTNRKQKTKVNLPYSPLEEILFDLAQGSIFGPLLFNIFLCDLFFIMNETEFVSYTDDNTPYRTVNTINKFIKSLEHDSIILFNYKDQRCGN